MSNTAFGVAQTSAGVGTTDTDMRHILAAQWESTGVINGLSVTGTTSLYYRVAAGTAVCSKGPSDGKTLAYFGGGNTDTVPANSSGNPRIDSVYIYSNDANQGDADNLVHIGVVEGTAAAVPTAPTIPTYATLLAQMVMPAGATTTANAHHAASVGYAIPYGASLGILDSYQDTTDTTVDPSTHFNNVSYAKTIYLPTDRLVEIEWARTMSAMDAGNPGSILERFDIDGSSTYIEEVGTDQFWQTRHVSYVTELQAGNHTITFRDIGHAGGAIWYHYDPPSGQTAYCNGQTYKIIDRGVVR